MPHKPLATLLALMIALGLARENMAQTILIDFGNNNSENGTNVINPDSNGNF